MFLLGNKLKVLTINKIMQFYHYLIIKYLKLLNMLEYDKFFSIVCFMKTENYLKDAA